MCTAEHPFYVVGKGFVPAKCLKSSDKLLLSSGKRVIIEKIEVEKLETAETTYNFEVADFHTYYVSEKSILVHNMCQENTKEFKMANRGQSSTGRRVPYNLKEKLAMEQAISSPMSGEKLSIRLLDSRWSSAEGWIKMQQVFEFYDGSKTTIHYLVNEGLQLMDDFKFVFPI